MSSLPMYWPSSCLIPPAGADPKSVLCAFYKQGLCKKGDKCKFSHDLSLEAKSEKRSMYVDLRDEEDPQGDTMESWDEDQLRSVVDRKHGKEGQTRPKTDKAGRRVYMCVQLAGFTLSLCVCAGVQTLPVCNRERCVWLVLGVPQWRRQVHLPPRTTPWVCSEARQGGGASGGDNYHHTGRACGERGQCAGGVGGQDGMDSRASAVSAVRAVAHSVVPKHRCCPMCRERS